MDRRHFIRSIFVAAAAAGTSTVLRAQDENTVKSLNLAFRKIGFNPKAKGCGYFVIMADPHYAAPGTNLKSSAMECMPKVIKEIKSQADAPSFIITLGGLVSSGNPCFGASIKNTDNMMREFDMFKSHMAELAPIPYKVVVGNHDCTGPRDTEFKDFKKAFPSQPLYESFDFNGIHCIILNGGHCGMLDDEQQKWLLDDIKSVKDGQNIIIFVHQPLGAIRSEWKLSKSVRDAVSNFSGDVFVFAGHNHAHNVGVLKTRGGKRISQVTVEAFRQNNAPVYWVCCVRNGAIVGAIFRDRNGDFRIIDTTHAKASDWLLPWEGMDVLATFDNSSPEFHETARKGGDCVYFYFYLKHLEGWLDLSKIDSDYSTLYLMGTTLKRKGDPSKDAKLWLSADGKNFEEVKIGPQAANLSCKVELPPKLRNAKKLFFKMDFPYTDGGFTGFAIAK